MRQRIQVGAGIDPVRLQPTATPVDTFHTSQAGRQLSQLAQGLSQLSPELAKLGGVLGAQYDQQQAEAGRQKAFELIRKMKESNTSYAQAIKDGTIPSGGSPWFRAKLDEELGSAAASDFHANLTMSLATDDVLRNATTVEEYEKRAAELQGDFLKNQVGSGADSPNFQNGFGARAQAAVDQARNEFVQGAQQRLEQSMDDTIHTRVFTAVEDMLDKHLDPATIGGDLTHLLDGWYGVDPKGATRRNNTTLDAIIAVAREKQDASLLDIAEHVLSGPAGSGGKRAGIHTIKGAEDKILQARADIGSRMVQEASEEKTLQTLRTEKALKPVWDQVATTLEGYRDNPEGSRTVLDALRKQIVSVDPTKATLVDEMRDAYVNREEKDNLNPFAYNDLLRRVFDPSSGEHTTTGTEVATQLAQRHISPEQYHTVRSLILQKEELAKTAGRERSDPSLSDGVRRARTMFVAEFGESQEDQRARAEVAESKFRERYYSWRMGEGAKANQLQTDAFISNTVQDIYAEVVGPDADTDILAIPGMARAKRRYSLISTGQAPDASAPAAPRPQTVDPKKVPVVATPVLRQLEQEFNDLHAGKRNRYSLSVVGLLKQYGVAPTPEAVQEFIAAQKSLSK